MAKVSDVQQIVSALRAAAEALARGLPSGDELSAGAVGSPDRNSAMVVSIAVPKHLASRFPGSEYNHGHEPHLTLCFITADALTQGQANSVLSALRQISKRIPPFRVALDCAAGLQDFGDGQNGEKALWFKVKDDPTGNLVKVHRLIRQALKDEGLPCEHQHDFTGHVTWSYVPNDQPEAERQRMSNLAANRFNDVSRWFDVRHLLLSMPDGSSKTIALTPALRK